MSRSKEDPITCVNKLSRDYSHSSPNREEILIILPKNRQLKDLLITFI